MVKKEKTVPFTHSIHIELGAQLLQHYDFRKGFI